MSVKKFLKTAQDIRDKSQRSNEIPRAKSGDDESGWLVSYADMMTLLCGFFILLFSMAKLDEPQFEKVKEVVAKQFGGDYKSPNQELARFVTQVLEQAGIEKDVSIKSDPIGVSLVFQSRLFFDTLSADVKPEGKAVLDKLIHELGELQIKEAKQYQIVVEGHTDSRPILAGSYPSNWELSGARASRVIRMFLDQKFAPDKLTAIGYADTRPEVAPRNALGAYDETALTKNRRVVLRILDPKMDVIPMPQQAQAVNPATGVPTARVPASH